VTLPRPHLAPTAQASGGGASGDDAATRRSGRLAQQALDQPLEGRLLIGRPHLQPLVEVGIERLENALARLLGGRLLTCWVLWLGAHGFSITHSWRKRYA
jgi:hypothetical protein